MGPAQSQKVSSVPELVLSASPGVCHARYETNEFKEAVQNEATPQLIPTQELDDNPQVTSLSPPLDKDENVNIGDNVSKAQTDDDVELEDKEQKHRQHQHQVSSTPPPFRTQESPQSPSTPTPTLQLFKEDGLEAVRTICEKQQQQQTQGPQPLQKTTTQIDYTSIHNSELSKDEVIETLYAPEPAPLEAIKQAKGSEICTVVKEEPPALDEAEAVVETTGITAVESAEEASISLPSAVEEMEQTEKLKPEQDQNQNQEEEENSEEEEEGSKVIEEVVGTEEESLVIEKKLLEVEKKQVEEAKEEDKDVIVAEERFVLVVEEKQNKQEQEDIEVALQDDEVAFEEEEEVSASFDAAVLDSDAIETVDESLPTTEIQGEDQQLQADEAKLTVMIAEEPVESEAPEEPEPEDFEAPVLQEQVSTQQEVVETVELEEVPLDSVADEVVDSVVPVLDDEIKDVCHPEEVATPEILEVASVEQVESTKVLLLDDSVSLIEGEAVMVEVQAVDVEEIAILVEDIQGIEVVAQAEVTFLMRESELALEVVKTTEVIEAVHVDDNEVVESDIAAIEEEVATESIDEDVVTESTDEDIEVTETDQLDIENEELLSEEDTKSGIAETIVDEQLEIQESIKGASTEVEEVPENTSEPESFKKVEIDRATLSLEESDGVLEVSVVESSLEEEVEVEKVVEKDEIPSELIILESEATTEISETGASSAEEIPPVSDQIDPTCVAHKFVWNHGGQSVKVTGTFDDWQASVDLKKSDDAFEVIVGLNRTKLIHFKFVVDGQWLCASDLVTEFDHSGNQNHVLYALL
ncbi:hypothetical protein BGZ81_011198 [Podila clonocystis]|nr:hypothetical protein BGZ81_011198 [Podila clonocystis]